MTASWRSSPCGPRPPPGEPSPSVSEQVAEAQRVRHLQERRIVLRVGQHPLLPPAPLGLGMDVETAVYLRPRQVGLLLEPHQPFREVDGEAVGLSGVVYALSRHRSFWRTAAISLLCDVRAVRSPQEGRCTGAQAPAVGPSRSPGQAAACLPKAAAASPDSSICAGFLRCPLLARTADGQHHLVGQHPAVSRADGSLGVAVGRCGQGDDLAVAVRPDRDQPAQVAALCDPLSLLHLSPGHREGMVPQGLVAQAELLAEPQLEGEHVLPVATKSIARNAVATTSRPIAGLYMRLLSPFAFQTSRSRAGSCIFDDGDSVALFDDAPCPWTCRGHRWLS